MSLKDNWKETGDSLGKAFVSLGKTFVRTVSAGVKKAEEWANEESKPTEEEAPIPTEAGQTANTSAETEEQ